MTNPTKKIKISELSIGDTVIVNGAMQTVGRDDIRNDSFFGPLFKGDSYKAENGEIEIVLFPKWFKGEITGYYSQI